VRVLAQDGLRAEQTVTAAYDHVTAVEVAV
jgi:hypothetical protein